MWGCALWLAHRGGAGHCHRPTRAGHSHPITIPQQAAHSHVDAVHVALPLIRPLQAAHIEAGVADECGVGGRDGG